MSCHPLQVDEVLRSIVEEVISLNPRSVLSLALCCSYLTDVSLSVLWEQQRKLSTLIKVLPPDAWAYEETQSPAGQLVSLNRPRPGSCRVRCSVIRFADDRTGYIVGRMGKVEEIRFMDAGA